jgi:ubiquinone/menaquinone biosynthesis C-methylase UbiE
VTTKDQVHKFWNDASCGENLYLSGGSKAAYAAQSAERYRLEPLILRFANFESAAGKKVLELGVGLGADHQCFAEAGADLWGVDLTKRAVEHTARRFEFFGLRSQLAVGDAENLQFENDTFDLVYSWGALHHTPNTPKAIQEVFRVLKRGG